MPLIAEIVERAEELAAWRHRLHAYPEVAFEEHETAAFVAARLREFGYAVSEGLARTGVVGTLVNGEGPAIGLRADLDALPMQELNEFAYRSTIPGRMHACGHDGHIVMLLAAARYLATSRRFRGTLRVIFQPAEENEAGGRVMVEDGLFRLFPVDAVYGLHNWPALPATRIAVRAGPVMAACDVFEIELTGNGCHGGMPHLGTDPIIAAAALAAALQTVVSRSVNPADAAVVSVTQIHAGETWNVIPERALLRGTTRSFRREVQDVIEAKVARLADGVARAYGCEARIDYQRRYPATVNEAAAAERAARAAADVVGASHVVRDVEPSMGAEDFAFMLDERPGCYVWLGSGGHSHIAGLHNPRYDFNDSVLTIGASYWATLVEQELAAG